MKTLDEMMEELKSEAFKLFDQNHNRNYVMNTLKIPLSRSRKWYDEWKLQKPQQQPQVEVEVEESADDFTHSVAPLRAVALYKRGVPAKDIARKLGVKTTQIMEWVMLFNEQEGDASGLTAEEKDCIKRLLDNGMSVERVALDFGIDEVTVQKVVGITFLPQKAPAPKAEKKEHQFPLKAKKPEKKKKRSPRPAVFLTEKDKKDMAKLYVEEEVATNVLAERFNCSQSRVSKILKEEMGIQLRLPMSQLFKKDGKYHKKAVKMVGYGKSIEEIAKELNFSVKSVKAWQARNPIAPGKPLPDPISQEDQSMIYNAKSLYENGSSLAEVSFFLKVPKEAILDWLEEHNVEIRKEDRNVSRSVERSRQQARFLSDRGGNLESIANILQLPKSLVEKWIKSRGNNPTAKSH